jgi:hypothetical protein
MPHSSVYSSLGEDRYYQGVYDLHSLPDDQGAPDRIAYHAVNQQPEPAESEKSSLKLPWSVRVALDDWWVLETIALVLSAVLLVAVYVLLQSYDGEPQPDWELISLNTIVSWLGTLSKSMVLVPVSRSLGQLKWVWYARKPRAMSDLHKFDAASRGVLGSLELLFSESGRYVMEVYKILSILTICKVSSIPGMCRYGSCYRLWPISAKLGTLLSTSHGRSKSAGLHHQRIPLLGSRLSSRTRV